MKKRAFVRYSKQGKIVPGSLILTSGSYPQGSSTWSEVPADLCCETVTLINRITDPAITNVSIRFYCNNTSVTVEYGSQTSTTVESLATILNEDFGSQFGVFSSTSDGAITLAIKTDLVKELCPNGVLSFNVFSD